MISPRSPATALVAAAFLTAGCGIYAAGAAPAGAAGTIGDPRAGEQVYAKWCGECHDKGPNHPGTQSLAIKYRGKDIPAALPERTDLPAEAIAYFVRHGVALMPQFRKTEITEAQLRDLSAWLARER